MRSKTPLVLMEQVVMVLVFALAAALCLKVFVFSEQVSARNEAVDRAVVEAQNAAEILKSSGADLKQAQEILAEQLGGSQNQGVLQIGYDREWKPAAVLDDACAYMLQVRELPAEVDGLVKAAVTVAAKEETATGGEALFSLQVAWQEVAEHGA